MAIDVAKDLALLSINRRFVISFNDLLISEVDNLVGSQFLIQCTPPTTAWPYSAVESRISRRARFKDFEPGLVKTMTQQFLTDDSVRWIQHQHDGPLKVGAPLFADDGSLVAINTSAIGENQRDVFAIPAKHILELKQQASDDVLPLPLPYADTATDDSPVVSSDLSDSQMNVVHSGSTLREISESLNRVGKQCQLFDYWPTTETESKQLKGIGAVAGVGTT